MLNQKFSIHFFLSSTFFSNPQYFVVFHDIFQQHSRTPQIRISLRISNCQNSNTEPSHPLHHFFMFPPQFFTKMTLIFNIFTQMITTFFFYFLFFCFNLFTDIIEQLIGMKQKFTFFHQYCYIFSHIFFYFN